MLVTSGTCIAAAAAHRVLLDAAGCRTSIECSQACTNQADPYLRDSRSATAHGGAMPRVLNVAEKPSVAKEVARILSGGNVQRRNGA